MEYAVARQASTMGIDDRGQNIIYLCAAGDVS